MAVPTVSRQMEVAATVAARWVNAVPMILS
jgi:hypothetical protein